MVAVCLAPLRCMTVICPSPSNQWSYFLSPIRIRPGPMRATVTANHPRRCPSAQPCSCSPAEGRGAEAGLECELVWKMEL